MPAPQIFPNSLQHRRRVRLWMAALVTLPMLTGVQFSKVHPCLWKAVDNESVPSTRFFIEWVIILGLLKHQRPEDLQNLLSRLLEFNQATGTAISLLTVTMHVGLKLEGELKERFFELVFDRILPWHLHNNHMVRLFASFVFDRLWSHVITDRTLSHVERPEGYANMAAFLNQGDHSKKFLEKLRKEYFLSRFDPIVDYNIQTIFSILPEESDIAKNESISMYSFINVEGTPGNIPFGEDPLIGCLGELQLSGPASSPKDDGGGLDNFQQKIDPWDMEVLDQDMDQIRMKREIQRKKKSAFDMVIVASLVDRIPNLAGLSRTCEIFGATSLALPSLAVCTDPNFQNISMTSEHWLETEECRPSDLISFLGRKRMEDYRIVAIEQSSQSHSLLHYEFPPKCCLVLGNENHGVPAEILHLVDDCIEIPQFGIIRSLNVHVSGSVVLWEARRQFELSKGV